MRIDKFIFCEGAREEKGGQWTLIGVLPGDGLALQGAADAPFLLPSLACLIVLDEMRGVSEITIQLEITFGGRVIIRTPQNTQRRSPPDAQFHTQALTFNGFKCDGFGKYTFTIVVSAPGVTKRFSRNLSVEPAQPPPPQFARH